MLRRDADYFYELQTQTGWGRTLSSFGEWCDAQPGWLTLDVGCGPGLLPAIFARSGCKAVGIDIDPAMFRATNLYRVLVVADAFFMPFPTHTFDLITASNLLFLLPEPDGVLIQMKRVLKPGGKVALLNPSENMNINAAQALSEQRGLEGMARDSLLNWARRAEENHRWNENETRRLYQKVGLKYVAGEIKMGPGFARFSWGTT